METDYTYKALGEVLLKVDPDMATRNLKLADQQYKTASLEFDASKKSKNERQYFRIAV